MDYSQNRIKPKNGWKYLYAAIHSLGCCVLHAGMNGTLETILDADISKM